LANSGSKQREEFKKGALLTDCYTRRAEMDGKTQAASRHIGNPQGAQGKVNRVGGHAGRPLHNQYLCDFDRASRTAQKLPSYCHASPSPKNGFLPSKKWGQQPERRAYHLSSVPK